MDQGTYVDYSRRPQTSDTTWRSRPSARPINDQTPMSLKRSNLKHQAERRRWRYSSKRTANPKKIYFFYSTILPCQGSISHAVHTPAQRR
ncbi:hypothetical protein WG66_001819 [Moniliophthora roreri]|nr:hypothetical protein WG66_001819 [Moniliophthora roreri]